MGIGMFWGSSRLRSGAPWRSHAVPLSVAALTLSVALVGCTASPAPDAEAAKAAPRSTASAAQSVQPTTEPITTEWTAPDDPNEKGPTTAPDLPQQKGDLDEAISLSTGMSVSVESMKTIDVKPETPGEVAGSAVVVSVSLENISDTAQNVDSAVVTLEAKDGEPGIATTAGPNDPLSGEIAPGAKLTGSYVFMLDPVKGRQVSVSVNYAAGEPVALFSGKIR